MNDVERPSPNLDSRAFGHNNVDESHPQIETRKKSDRNGRDQPSRIEDPEVPDYDRRGEELGRQGDRKGPAQDRRNEPSHKAVEAVGGQGYSRDCCKGEGKGEGVHRHGQEETYEEEARA